MNLYLYCSSGSLLEYFTINKIVCNDYLSKKNRKIIHSLALQSNKFVFLTRKKLIAEKRMIGFEKDYLEIGAVLEIFVSEEDAKKIPVIALYADGKLQDECVYLSEAPEDSLGVFVAGEISFTYLSSIIFDNDNAKDDIYRPSPDLYFPEHLYTVIDDSFKEDIDADKIVIASQEIDNRFVDTDFVSSIIKRNKLTSMYLNFILETKGWPFGDKHKANFDDQTIGMLGIADRIDEQTGGLYSKLKPEELQDEILSKIDDEKDASSLAPLFKAIVCELIPITTNTFAKEEFDSIRDKVYENAIGCYSDIQKDDIKKKIAAIEELVYGLSSKGLEKLLSELPEPCAVLQALIFFLRSPQSGVKLTDGLNVYKAEPTVRRYAWILFSALNGLEPIPAEKTGNAFLMRIAESNAMEKAPDKMMISFVSSENIPKNEFVPDIEEEVSADLVRNLILSDVYTEKVEDLIKLVSANAIYKKTFKEKDYKIIKNPFTAFPNGDTVSVVEVEEYITKLQAAVKKSKAMYDTKKFLEDYIQDEKVFAGLYKKDKAFWKGIYKGRDKK